MRVDSAIAKLVAASAAVLFIGSGLYQFFPSNVRPPMLGVALVVSGTAILLLPFHDPHLDARASLRISLRQALHKGTCFLRADAKASFFSVGDT